jgi:hypothetical protein
MTKHPPGPPMTLGNMRELRCNGCSCPRCTFRDFELSFMWEGE